MMTTYRVLLVAALSAVLATVLVLAKSSARPYSPAAQRLTTAVAKIDTLDRGVFVDVWDALDDFVLDELSGRASRTGLQRTLDAFPVQGRVAFKTHAIGADRILVVGTRRFMSSTADFSGGRASVFGRLRNGRWLKLGSVDSRAAREFRLEWSGERRFVVSETMLGTQREDTSFTIVDVLPGTLRAMPWRMAINAKVTRTPRGITVLFDRQFSAFSSSAAGPYRKFQARLELAGARLHVFEKPLTPWFEALESQCAARSGRDLVTKALCSQGRILAPARRHAGGTMDVKVAVAKGLPCNSDASWWSRELLVSLKPGAGAAWRIHAIRSADTRCVGSAPIAPRAP